MTLPWIFEWWLGMYKLEKIEKWRIRDSRTLILPPPSLWTLIQLKTDMKNEVIIRWNLRCVNEQGQCQTLQIEGLWWTVLDNIAWTWNQSECFCRQLLNLTFVLSEVRLGFQPSFPASSQPAQCFQLCNDPSLVGVGGMLPAYLSLLGGSEDVIPSPVSTEKLVCDPPIRMNERGSVKGRRELQSHSVLGNGIEVSLWKHAKRGHDLLGIFLKITDFPKNIDINFCLLL